MRFIGDIHAKFGQYLAIIDGVEESIQVGDFGIGFRPVPFVPETHRFIRGNHDNPHLVRNHNWIPDGHHERGMFFVGGGVSIDKHLCTQGQDWWPEEELSTPEMYEIIENYEQIKPEILVCHECPDSVVDQLFGTIMNINIPVSRTSQFLGRLLDVHQPDIVIFGHWHVARYEVIGDTRFICLPELGYIDITI